MGHKNKTPKSDLRFRELPPRLNHTKKGIQILCPFCNPSHPILPGQESPCGTTLKVTAIQPYLSSHGAKHNRLVCLKCGQGAGEMVKYGSGYVHIKECAPEKKLITEPPPLSRMAKLIFRLPEGLRKKIEKRTGYAKELKEIDASGKETGKVLGYFFWKVGETNASR